MHSVQKKKRTKKREKKNPQFNLFPFSRSLFTATDDGATCARNLEGIRECDLSQSSLLPSSEKSDIYLGYLSKLATSTNLKFRSSVEQGCIKCVRWPRKGVPTTAVSFVFTPFRFIYLFFFQISLSRIQGLDGFVDTTDNLVHTHVKIGPRAKPRMM